MSGYYRMHRGWLDHPALGGAREPYCRRAAWAWLIDAAAWQENRVRIGRQTLTLRRGQLAHSLRFIAEQWGWDETKVRRFLAVLRDEGMVATSADAGTTVITLCNYDEYQGEARDGDADATRHPTQARRTNRRTNDAQTDAATNATTDAQETRATHCRTDEIPADASPGAAPHDAAADAAPFENRRTPCAEIDAETDANKKEVKEEKKLTKEADASLGEGARDEPEPVLFAADGSHRGKPPRRAASPDGTHRGSRLSAEWRLPEDWRTWAVAEGLAPEIVAREAAKFADYWHAAAGAKGLKADWPATWRTWIRRAKDGGDHGRSGGAGRQPRGGNGWLDLRREHGGAGGGAEDADGIHAGRGGEILDLEAASVRFG